MSYYLADTNGYLDDFANVGAMRQFSVWAAGVGGTVGEFAREGHADPTRLATDLKRHTAAGIVEEMRVTLLDAAVHADLTVIVTDGSGPDSDVRALWPDKNGVDDHGRSEADVHRDIAMSHRVEANRLEKDAALEPDKDKAKALNKRAAEHRYEEQQHGTAALIKEGRMTPVTKQQHDAAKLRVNASIENFAFDATSESALAWAKEHAADLVTGISKVTRERIKDLVSSAFEEQFDVNELADHIASEIGDDDRADTIARTETMRASNEGQQEAWDQAIDKGFLTGDEQQTWIATPDERLCPICDDLDGQTVGLDESFESDGDELDGPPAHPNCRCTVGLVP